MSKIDEAKDVLKQLGFPEKQQNDRSAWVLLALLDLKETDSWNIVSNNIIRIHEIIIFIEKYYGFSYKENSRESIRRQTIHQFEQAALVIRNVDDPKRPTNSGKTGYSITDESLELLKSYGSSKWFYKLKKYLDNKTTLINKYKKVRSVNQVRLNYNGHTICFKKPSLRTLAVFLHPEPIYYMLGILQTKPFL
jgi:adenine-specific DNA-methyltransferase